MSARDQNITEIIAEFSELFAFARTRWARAAEDMHPELKGISLLMLQIIKRRGPVSATALGLKLDMDKAMVSRHVSQLRDLGFVDAEESPEDRRVQLLTVSGEGHALLTRLRDRSRAAYIERFEGWSADDVESLRRALHRFNFGE